MRRREFIGVLGISIIAWMPRTWAQSAKIPKIGVLWPGLPEANASRNAAFRDRLRDLGYVENKTVAIHDRFAEGQLERLPELARELVALKVDVIVAISVVPTVAARQATSSIPIVMVHAGNPIGSGLINSLAHPGGNVTGTTSMLPELGGKQLEILHEACPKVSRIAILLNPNNAGSPPTLQDAAAAAAVWGLELVPIEVSRAEDFEAAFTQIRDARVDGVLIVVESLTFTNRKRIIDFAAQAMLPTIYSISWPVRDGGLLSYTPTSTSTIARPLFM
jgi:putative ABC transport system substrate-binding protein